MEMTGDRGLDGPGAHERHRHKYDIGWVSWSFPDLQWGIEVRSHETVKSVTRRPT